MDLKVNLLWTLGSYDTPLIHFVELLQNKQLAAWHGDLWDTVLRYVRERERLLDDPLATEAHVPGYDATWQQVRDIYTGKHRERVIVNALISYAHSLSACSSHGMGPWNRVKRLIEQEHEQKVMLNAATPL